MAANACNACCTPAVESERVAPCLPLPRLLLLASGVEVVEGGCRVERMNGYLEANLEIYILRVIYAKDHGSVYDVDR